MQIIHFITKVFLVVIGIDIRVDMSFSKAFDPDTRITAILLIVYPIAIATGTAPVQLPGHGLLVVLGG